MQPSHGPYVACCEYVLQSVCVIVPSSVPFVYLVQLLVVVVWLLVVVVWVCVLCGRWYAIMRCGVHPEVTVAEEQNGG